MADTEFERGKELTYPNFYPKLTFMPVFGRRGDFIWVEEVIGAWPEHDSEFTFIRSAVHDQRVDRLKEDNEQLKAESSELRKTLSEYEYKMDTLVDSLTGGLLSKSMDTPNDSIEDVVREHVEGNLAKENAKLRELLSSTLGQVKEMCESNRDRCATCPLHHGNDECRMVMACDDARELGMEAER